MNKEKSPKPQRVTHTPISQFGRDHWSLLGFIEVLCVDYKGLVSDKHRRNLRVNIDTHPLFGYWPGSPMAWSANYDTRLKDGSQIPNHDDFDCVEDLEAAGVLRNEGSAINPVFKLTPFGSGLCAALRAFKASGGSFATFDYAPASPHPQKEPQAATK